MYLASKAQHKGQDMFIVLEKVVEYDIIAKDVHCPPSTLSFVHPHQHGNLMLE